MKKKILAIGLVVALLAIMVVGGSLAWFTDEDQATNVFTIGSIEILQHEQQHVIDANGDKTPDLEAFENNKVLLPIVNTADPAADDNYQDKIVTVENVGKNEAYIQTYVAVPAALDVGLLILDDSNAAANGWVKSYVAQAQIDGLAYNVYKYVYTGTLAANATTEALLEGVYIHQSTDLEVYDNGDGTQSAYFVWNGAEIRDIDVAQNTVDVLVATQAIQADGFDSQASALDQLGNHPWA